MKNKKTFDLIFHSSIISLSLAERDSKRREATEKGEKDVVWSIWRGKVVNRKPPQPDQRLIKNAQEIKK